MKRPELDRASPKSLEREREPELEPERERVVWEQGGVDLRKKQVAAAVHRAYQQTCLPCALAIRRNKPLPPPRYICVFESHESISVQDKTKKAQVSFPRFALYAHAPAHAPAQKQKQKKQLLRWNKAARLKNTTR